jgi:hypothetical protein
VRWEELFEDLEAVLDEHDRAAFDADVADRERAERAALTLADRLRGQGGRSVRLRLLDGDRVEGQVGEVGEQWLTLDGAGSANVLVPLAAVGTVAGLGRAAAPDAAGLVRRLPLTVVLRGLSRDRATVRLRLLGGVGLDGTIDRVGVDHLDLAEHPVDEARRPSAVRGVVTVRVAALASVRAG